MKSAVALTIVFLALLPMNVAIGGTASTIQPGDRVGFGGTYCTLNYVYDGVGELAGSTFIGTAAHCVEGQIGRAVFTVDGERFGAVAYTGDYPDSANAGATVENGIPGQQLDFALILVDAEHAARVNGEVRGRAGMPTSVATEAATALGDVVHTSGHGMGFGFTATTREARSGVLLRHNATLWAAEIPIAPGDSGGPILHANGQALGSLTGASACVCVSLHFPDSIAVPVQIDGPAIAGVIDELHALAWPVELRTVS